MIKTPLDTAPEDIQKHSKPVFGLAEGVFVFVGFIISLSAFFFLNILIEKMIEDEYDQRSKSGVEYLISGLSDLESAMSVVTSVFTLTADQDQAYQSQQFKDAFENIKRFDQILVLNEGKQPSKSFQRNDQVNKLYALKTSSQADIERLHRHLKEKGFFDPKTYPRATLMTMNHDKFAKGDEDNHMRILSNPGLFDKTQSGLSDNQEAEYALYQTAPFAIVKFIPGPSPSQTSLIIGVTHIGKIFSQEWLENNPHVSYIAIKDVETGQDFFFHDQDISSHHQFAGFERVSSDFRVGDKVWGAHLNFVKENTIHFIQAIPYFILFFGFVITGIGVLFVHNNQKHSVRLKSMNKKLELKNYELQSEIEKRASLNDFLHKSEQERRAIVDSVNDIIFETDTDGRIVFLNATWQKVTGFDPEQSVDLDLFKMLHPAEQDKQKKDFDLLVAGKKDAYRSFTRLRTSEGHFRAVELSISMMRQNSYKDMRVVGTFTDVEERRRAERALSEAEKKYRNIVENAAGGIFQLTPEGVYLSANPAFAKIFGYRDSQELLKNIKNANEELYVNTKHRREVLKTLEEHGDLSNIESEVRKSDGQHVWINENVRVVRDDLGNILYYEGSIEDITQRKSAHLAMREAKVHSDLANRAKSEFLANMSHELRTPLNAIIGFSEMIKNEVFGKIEQENYTDYANDIYQSGTNLLDIINEILDISRIEANERRLNENLTSLNDVANICLNLLDAKIKDNDLVVTSTLSSAPIVVAEELALKQVFMNLLSNAIKFTPRGGRITLSHELDHAGGLHVSITDTGVGLDDDEIEKVLSPFGQVEGTYSRSHAGTGLGLTLVEALIKLHGGMIEILSQKGIGTTVTFILPESRVQKSDEEQAASPALENKANV